MANEPDKPKPVDAKGATIAAAIMAAVAIAAPLGEKWEGYAARPYLDPAHIKTGCFGETEDPAYLEDRIYSRTECGRQLRNRLARDYAPRLIACRPELADPKLRYVFGALLDASYNAGPTAVCQSRMARAIAAGRPADACDLLPGWYVTAKNRRTGVRVTLPGLINRRNDERRVCRKGMA